VNDIVVEAEDVVGPEGVMMRALRKSHWFVGGHWLRRWFSARAVKFWRYSAGSVVAYVVSGVVAFTCLDWLSMGAITSATIAFVAGAIPNWVLNRSWAWQRRGREGIVKETGLYVTISLVSYVLTVGATKLAALSVDQMHTTHTTKSLLLTLSYLFAVAVLTIVKYVAYDRFVFTRRTSRSQVPSTTEANRRP
jgi:putative flippase GtrA